MNDVPLELSARELGLLEILLQRPGRLVSKEQLVDHLCEWGEEVSNNAIEVYVHRLRKKLEPGGIRIVTVRGLGYCLERHGGRWRRRCRGAREVGFTVLSMSLSLVAVFIPILAMGGIVGRLFREFAVTLSVACSCPSSCRSP